jgi:gamma-glutamyl:cysteine ligase YbdK (ATP-grasp superfamily)
MNPQDFLRQYRFRADLTDFVGVEVEGFLVDPDTNAVVPRAAEFLDEMRGSTWGHELSACQVEFRTRPLTNFSQTKDELTELFADGEARARELGLVLRYTEVGPAEMPLTIYPHSTRYRQIAAEMDEEKLRAACRVAGVHLHYGVANWSDALAVYDRLRRALPNLIKMGDRSDGERMRLYRLVSKRRDPPELKTTDDLVREAMIDGFFENPRGCWWLLRISTYGTVEVRVFGTTADPHTIVDWIREVSQIARPSVGGHW